MGATLFSGVNLQELSSNSAVPVSDLITHLFLKGQITTVHTIVSEEMFKELSSHFPVRSEHMIKPKLSKPSDSISELLVLDEKRKTSIRAPVITVMGHVDHGKTTLLDTIRGANVSSSEFSGITQTVGAHHFFKGNSSYTFIDTPGHYLFSGIRHRSVSITDIVVLIISAVDGIQQQTIECINIALSSKAKIVVFFNKMDRFQGNLDLLKRELASYEIVVEELGGDVMYVYGSAKTGDGIEKLLESVSLLAELEDLKTTDQSPAVGAIIDVHVLKGIGGIATVILKFGVVKPGNYFVTESCVGKVKGLRCFGNKTVKSAEASVPVMVSGFKHLPSAGEVILFFSDKASAEKCFNTIQALPDGESLKETKTGLSALIKSDCSGSTDALVTLTESLGVIIRGCGIGLVSSADIALAAIDGSFVINFNQRIEGQVQKIAKGANVKIYDFRTVYEVQEMLEQFVDQAKIIDQVEEERGIAKVVKLWKHSKIGTIAGCKTMSGEITKKDRVHVIRDGEILFTSRIKTFKCEDYAIEKSSMGQECGIVVEGWNNIVVGDEIRAFVMIDEPQIS